MLDSSQPFNFSDTPQAVSCYSDVDGILEYNSTTALRRFIGAPPIGTNLLSSLHSEADVSLPARRLDPVVEACLLSQGKQALLQAHVITRRGVLTRYSGVLTVFLSVLTYCSLSNPQVPCEFLVSLVDSRLFIERCDIGNRGGP
jgi:hypothetical protein